MSAAAAYDEDDLSPWRAGVEGGPVVGFEVVFVGYVVGAGEVVLREEELEEVREGGGCGGEGCEGFFSLGLGFCGGGGRGEGGEGLHCRRGFVGFLV